MFNFLPTFWCIHVRVIILKIYWIKMVERDGISWASLYCFNSIDFASSFRKTPFFIPQSFSNADLFLSTFPSSSVPLPHVPFISMLSISNLIVFPLFLPAPPSNLPMLFFYAHCIFSVQSFYLPGPWTLPIFPSFANSPLSGAIWVSIISLCDHFARPLCLHDRSTPPLSTCLLVFPCLPLTTIVFPCTVCRSACLSVCLPVCLSIESPLVVSVSGVVAWSGGELLYEDEREISLIRTEGA